MSLDFRVDRDSPKWVLGPNGYLIQYGNDEAAIEFNADGSYKGVLVEPQSTNLLLYSQEFDNAYWTKSTGSVSANSTTAPDGTLSADTYIVDNGETVNSPIVKTYSLLANTTYTLSLFVKRKDYDTASIRLYTQETGFSINSFDLANETASNGTIRKFANGWYRVTVTLTTSSSVTNGQVQLIRDAELRDGTSGIFIWGAQVEESPIATSYIPTTTGAVTRVKDDIYLTSASSLIGQTEGTLFIEVDWNGTGVDGLAGILLSINDGSVNNRVLIYRRTSVSPDELSMLVQVNGGSLVVDGEDLSAYTGIQKISVAYANNDQKMFRNGSEIASTSTSTTGFSMTNVDFGAADVGSGAENQANMWIRAVALFTSRLTDTQCEDLTSLDRWIFSETTETFSNTNLIFNQYN